MPLCVNTLSSHWPAKFLSRTGHLSRMGKHLMYPVYSRCMTANFFCTLNQQHVSTYYQIKSQCSKYIHKRHSNVTHRMFWNDNFQVLYCMYAFMHYEYTAQSKHIFQRNYIH